ncbi:MAG: 5,6-dimethylbenzimidazole synthase [Pseudomonadota bacterium]
MQFSQKDVDAFLKLSRWRRDVRHFSSKPVDEKMLETLKQSVVYAPSVGNSRPWRFVLVESPALRSEILENYHAANRDASELYDEAEHAKYLAMKLAGLREAPVHLAVFTDPDPINGKGLGRQSMPETLQYSTVSAIHQLWLAARSLNLGVGWVSIINPQALNELLNVDPAWIFTAYLCVGYAAQDSTEPELQKNGWQENIEADWLRR